MPIYEYHCANCGTTFELMRPMAQADDEAPCEGCGGTQARRILSTFAAFSSEGGQRRAVAGGSPCSGCTPSPSACSACGVKR